MQSFVNRIPTWPPAKTVPRLLQKPRDPIGLLQTAVLLMQGRPQIFLQEGQNSMVTVTFFRRSLKMENRKLRTWVFFIEVFKMLNLKI